MDVMYQKKITKNLVYIKENITQLGKVMDKLIESDHISMDEKADILTEKNMDTQCHILLETLMKRGAKAFLPFIEALRISGNGHVADKILQTEVQQQDDSKIEREETFFEIDDRQEEIIQLIKDRELYKMKFNELKSKYTTIKAESNNKSENIEMLTTEIEKLKFSLSSAEKRLFELDNKDNKNNRKKETSGSQKNILTDDVDGLETLESSVEDNIYADKIVLKMEQQTVTIEELTKETEYYRTQVKILENQVEDQRASLQDKDDQIMKLRNSVGKLQIYMQAGKDEREKIAGAIRQKMDKNQKANEERFDRIEDKINILIDKMCGSQNTTLMSTFWGRQEIRKQTDAIKVWLKPTKQKENKTDFQQNVIAISVLV